MCWYTMTCYFVHHYNISSACARDYCRYSILAITGTLMLMSIFVMGTRHLAEGFASIWSALMLLMLSIGGTMIMRKFHNSMAVGFFMGSVVAMSQMFFLLFLMYVLSAF
jgi:hypothetical protein